jgi:hypothetical protein
MKTFYLYTHLGLGDAIICNGLIREVCKKYNHVSIFCKPEYYKSVSFMLRDISNLQIIESDDKAAQLHLSSIPEEYKYVVGHDALRSLIAKNTFDECFYKQIGLNFSKRWDSFYLKRDPVIEENLYHDLAPKQPYAFVHDDHRRGYAINEKYIDPNLVIFRPSLVDNIFTYCKLIENATEIHCMDSSFKHLIDSLDLNLKPLFYHLYVRGITNQNYAQSKLLWNKIVYP